MAPWHWAVALRRAFASVLPERACKIQVGIMNGTPNLPNQQAIDMMQQTFNNKDSWEGLGRIAWPSMRRLADRLDPSYQQ